MKWQDWFYVTRGQRLASIVLVIAIAIICAVRFIGNQSEEAPRISSDPQSMVEVDRFLSTLKKDSVKSQTTKAESNKKTTTAKSSKTKKKTTKKEERKK